MKYEPKLEAIYLRDCSVDSVQRIVNQLFAESTLVPNKRKVKVKMNKEQLANFITGVRNSWFSEGDFPEMPEEISTCDFTLPFGNLQVTLWEEEMAEFKIKK